MPLSTDEFLLRVAEALDVQGELSTGQSLDTLDEWDSLGVLALIDLYEELDIPVELGHLEAATTTDDLVALAGSRISD